MIQTMFAVNKKGDISIQTIVIIVLAIIVIGLFLYFLFGRLPTLVGGPRV